MSRLLSTDVLVEPLTTALPAGEEVLDGTPTAGLAELLGDTAGVWEMGVGTVRDTEDAELFLVLAGRATLAFEDGETLDLRPGVLVRLAAGDRTVWTVTEPLRKLYVAL